MIPDRYLVPYLLSNAIALALLALSFRRARWVRWASIAIFAWAAFTNARIAIWHPADYQMIGDGGLPLVSARPSALPSSSCGSGSRKARGG